MGRLVGVRVGNEIRQQQADARPCSKTFGQSFRFSGPDDGIVSPVQRRHEMVGGVRDGWGPPEFRPCLRIGGR